MVRFSNLSSATSHCHCRQPILYWKISDENSTVSTVRLLDFDERVEEIAKMLAGENVKKTEAALEPGAWIIKEIGLQYFDQEGRKMTDYFVIGMFTASMTC